MRSATRICLALCIAILICSGCAGSGDVLKRMPETIDTVNPAKGLNKIIAIALTHTPPSPVGRQLGELYLNALMGAIREEGHQLSLVTRQDADWPDDMTELMQAAAMPENVPALAKKARLAGFNGMACARIENIWPGTRKAGILWFRKEHYLLFMQMTFNVYDPFSGAKIFDQVVETSTRISEDLYSVLKSGEAIDLEEIEDAVVDIAGDLGERAADAIGRQPWQASVLKVEGRRVFLAAGSRAGLQGGERLAVLEARRILDGQNGAKFIVPGYKVAEIEIVDVADRISEARDQTDADGSKIQAGDIAVAIKK